MSTVGPQADVLAVNGGAPVRRAFLPYHQPWLGQRGSILQRRLLVRLSFASE